MLHGDRDRDRIAHRPHAVGHELRLGHQASAERAMLNALTRTTAVQVDLVIAPALAEPRAGSEFGRLAAAELQGHRMLGDIEVEMPRDIAMQQSAGCHHLGVEPGTAGQQAMEETAMPVRPVHHRRRTQTPWTQSST